MGKVRMAICFIVLCLLLIIAKTQEQVFIVDEYGHIIEECNGSIKLQREGNQRVVHVESTKIKGRKKTIGRTAMRIAVVRGGCCWEVKNQYVGESKHLKADTHQLPWDIKSLRLVK